MQDLGCEAKSKSEAMAKPKRQSLNSPPLEGWRFTFGEGLGWEICE